MGYISTLQTKLEQMLCSRGYSDTLAGMEEHRVTRTGTSKDL